MVDDYWAMPRAISSLRLSDPRSLLQLLAFATVLWGALARGAFYRLDLIVFVVLAVVMATMTFVVGTSMLNVCWWVITAIPVALTVAVSAVTDHDLADSVYALAPILVATSLGLVGASVCRLGDRLLVLRTVADVAALLALLSWLGVALHLRAFAQQLNQGWRASATIGYANVNGLFLLTGLLCAVGLAVQTGQATDELRCLVLALGLLTTQSRSALLAGVVCGVTLLASNRKMMAALVKAFALAAIAFVGLLPSIHNMLPDIWPALLAAGMSVTVLVGVARVGIVSPRIRWVVVIGLGSAAAVVSSVGLATRLLDGRSGRGRVELWQDAIAQVRAGGLFGQGPHQLASLGEGHVVASLLHNDVLQYAIYYGITGFLAFAFVAWRVGVAFVQARARVQVAVLWNVGLTVVIATGLVALVDFPLQVPLIPAVVALVVGVAVRPSASRQMQRGVQSAQSGDYVDGIVSPSGDMTQG